MQRTRLAAALSTTLSAAFIPTALAASLPPAEYTLEEIVVTATRIPQKKETVAGDVSVLTRSDIEASGQSTLVELLGNLPGVEMTQNGGAGAVSSVHLRGANAGHTLVLMDGVRMTSATLGTARLEHIPVGLINRIEVVRGPMSHMYGADAIGGVIQIFTRRGQGMPRLTTAVGYGSYGHAKVDAALTGGKGALDYAIAAGHDEQEGFSAKSTAYDDKDGYRNSHASLRLGYVLNGNHRLSLQGFVSDGRSQFDDGLTPYDSHSKARLDNLGVGLESRLSADWDSTLRIDRSSEKVNTQGDSYSSEISMTQWQSSWQLDGRTAWGDLQVVLEHLQQDIGGNVAYDLRERNRDALALSWHRDVGAHGVNLSVRRDDDSQFGHHDTGALGYSYKFSPNWRMTTSYGSSFRAPSFDDLYWPNEGNPSLKPETGRSREVGLYYQQGTRAFSATAYRNDVSGLIQWAPDADGNWLPSNVAKARLQGLSLNWADKLGDFKLKGALDMQSPENAETGKLLILRSRQHASLGVEYAASSKLRWSADMTARGKRFNDAGNTESQKVSGFAVVNLGANYQIGKDWQLQANLNNVLDKDYRLASGYNTAGRNFFLTLRYAPK